MKILIVSDAWHPQINGVVRSLENTAAQLEKMGHQPVIYGPDHGRWTTVQCPVYPEIALELFPAHRFRDFYDREKPDLVHIATEGPLGWSARNMCLRRRIPFTTSYHTRFAEYLSIRAPRGLQRITEKLAYIVLRRFHAPASAVMVATASIESDLRRRKFRRIVRWSRGVDIDMFTPAYGKVVASYDGLLRPIYLNVGRVAAEKNLRVFLDAEVPGSKVVIGEGPDMAQLRGDYPQVKFLGPMQGQELARHYAAADIFAFPSLTDTFGLVLLEACASGLRIAACPVPGPADIFANPETRRFVSLRTDFAEALREAAALSADPESSRAFVASNYSWEASTRVFFQHLQAPTPEAVRRITRLKGWMSRSWQRALAYAFK